MVLLNWHTGIVIIDRFILNGATFMTGFFVLSGFILTHVHMNSDFTKKREILNFFIRRIAKIYPTYIIATITFFIIYHNLSNRDIIRIVLNDISLTQAFYPSMFSLGINGGTWSISVEMFLYFLFPFFMIIFRNDAKIIIIGFLLVTLASLNIALVDPLEDKFAGDILYSNPVFRLGEFCLGIGFYFIKENKVFQKKHGLVLTSVLLFLACTYLGHFRNQYMLGQFLIAPLFGVLITFAFYSKSIVLNNGVLEYLRKISYSFYLWQFLWTIFINANNININHLIIFHFLITLIIASISFYFIEEGVRRKILLLVQFNKQPNA
jgi:peptidoglycan/LPS O-acetylase OafA/YrhL